MDNVIKRNVQMTFLITFALAISHSRNATTSVAVAAAEKWKKKYDQRKYIPQPLQFRMLIHFTP